MPQYIPTCDPSHPLLITSLKKWISSLPVSHVSRSQTPVQEKAQKMNAGFGIQSSKPLGKLDPHTYSWRTFQTSLMNGGHLMKFQSPWPKSGSILNGVLLERPTLEQIIKETVYSSLPICLEPFQESIFPTPTASDGSRNSKRYGGGNLTLFGKVSQLTTPTTSGNQLCPSEMKKGGSFNNLKQISNLHGGEGTRLSPLFVEWMMGFPTGWTDLER